MPINLNIEMIFFVVCFVFCKIWVDIVFTDVIIRGNDHVLAFYLLSLQHNVLYVMCVPEMVDR